MTERFCSREMKAFPEVEFHRNPARGWIHRTGASWHTINGDDVPFELSRNAETGEGIPVGTSSSGHTFVTIDEPGRRGRFPDATVGGSEPEIPGHHRTIYGGEVGEDGGSFPVAFPLPGPFRNDR